MDKLDDIDPQELPHSSMEITGGSAYQGRTGIGFDHAHLKDWNQYTPFERVVQEVQWYYGKCKKIN